MTTTPTAGGRRRQDLANDAAAGRAPRCGARKTVAGRPHVCTRPPHPAPLEGDHYFRAEASS